MRLVNLIGKQVSPNRKPVYSNGKPVKPAIQVFKSFFLFPATKIEQVEMADSRQGES